MKRMSLLKRMMRTDGVVGGGHKMLDMPYKAKGYPRRVATPGHNTPPTALHTSHPDFPMNDSPRRTHYPGMAEGTPLAAMRKTGTDFGSPWVSPKTSFGVLEGLVPSGGVASMAIEKLAQRPLARPRNMPRGARMSDGPTSSRQQLEIGGPRLPMMGGADSLAAGGPPSTSLGRVSDGPQGSRRSSKFVHDLSAPDIMSGPAPVPGLMSPEKAAVADLARSDVNAVQIDLYGQPVATRITGPDPGNRGMTYRGPEMAGLSPTPSSWIQGNTQGPIRHSPSPSNTPAGNPAISNPPPGSSGASDLAFGLGGIAAGIAAGGVASYATGGEFGQGAVAGGIVGGAAWGAAAFGGRGLRMAARGMFEKGGTTRNAMMGASSVMSQMGMNSKAGRAGMYAGGALVGGFMFGGNRSHKRGFNSNRGNSIRR